MDEGGAEIGRVANIKNILPELPLDKLASSLSNHYFAIYDRENSEEGLNPITVKEILRWQKIANLYPEYRKQIWGLYSILVASRVIEENNPEIRRTAESQFSSIKNPAVRALLAKIVMVIASNNELRIPSEEADQRISDATGKVLMALYGDTDLSNQRVRQELERTKVTKVIKAVLTGQLPLPEVPKETLTENK